MVEMLKQIPCFIEAKPPSTKMSDFFPLTKWISLNLEGDPPVFVSAWLPFSTPESIVSYIQLMQGYTAQKTVEVANLALFLAWVSLVAYLNTYLNHVSRCSCYSQHDAATCHSFLTVKSH